MAKCAATSGVGTVGMVVMTYWGKRSSILHVSRFVQVNRRMIRMAVCPARRAMIMLGGRADVRCRMSM